MKYNKYPKYKDSGVEWIGEIPEHWEVTKLKFLKHGDLLYGANEESVIDENYPRFIRITDITPNGELKNKNIRNIIPEKAKTFMLEEGDLLLARSGSIGRSFLYSNIFGQCSFASYLIRFRSNKSKVLPQFIKYYTHTNYYETQIQSGAIQSTIQNFNAEKFGNLIVIVTSLEEQEQIIRFLDKQTTQFDELIVKFKEQIILLKEKKQAMINQTVTKGLDSSVPMKDSGVEWIGDIPKTWDIKPLFSVCKDNKKKNFDNKIKNVLSLSYGKIKRRDVETNFGLLPASFETYQILDNGDIVLRLTDLQNDKRSLRVGLVAEKGIITSAYTGLKIVNSINGGFLYNLLHFYDIAKIFYGLGSGVRQSMTFSDLKRLPLVIPSKNESDKIYDFLNQQTTYFDELITKSKVQVNLLQEKKQTLITLVTTGKIDVREAIA